jgi:NlpC/P60 family putative phage cell wall peptidase
MTTRAEIIAEARSWKGTPYRHQGRLKGVAVDCAGLVNKSGETFGCVSATDANKTDYLSEPDPIKMKAALDKLYIRIPKTEMRPADIPWMRARSKAQHIGILSERNTLIHAVQNYDVQELPIDNMVTSRIVAVYRFKGVSD